MAYDNIKLEKGLYTTGKSFTDTLEKLDPSENYRGTALEGLDAFERQLKRFDIKVSGHDSDTISKFFKTTDSSALFPEYVSRAVMQGVLNDQRVENIIATTTEIDGFDYRSIKPDENQENYSLIEVGEGTILPEMNISVNSELTKLKKYGKMLCASYEAIKFQKLDLFSLTLKRIGESIANSQFVTALGALAGNKNVEKFTIAGPELEYSDLVKLWVSMQPYNLNTIISGSNATEKMLNMPQFRDGTAGLDFHGSGNIITPFGAKVINTTHFENEIIALDKNYALEKVQAGGIVTEFDKLIDRQLERATISTIVGFSVIFPNSAKVMQPGA